MFLVKRTNYAPFGETTPVAAPAMRFSIELSFWMRSRMCGMHRLSYYDPIVPGTALRNNVKCPFDFSVRWPTNFSFSHTTPFYVINYTVSEFSILYSVCQVCISNKNHVKTKFYFIFSVRWRFFLRQEVQIFIRLPFDKAAH